VRRYSRYPCPMANRRVYRASNDRCDASFSDSGAQFLEWTPAGTEPTTAQSRRPAQGTPQPPKSQVVIAVITTILTIGFAAGATMTVSMYRAASAEFQQAEKALSDANSDLSAAQEAAQ